jgi:hypothetical protein
VNTTNFVHYINKNCGYIKSNTAVDKTGYKWKTVVGVELLYRCSFCAVEDRPSVSQQRKPESKQCLEISDKQFLSLSRIWAFLLFLHENRGAVASILVSYFGGSRFKSHSGDQLSWVRIILVFLISLRQIID